MIKNCFNIYIKHDYMYIRVPNISIKLKGSNFCNIGSEIKTNRTKWRINDFIETVDYYLKNAKEINIKIKEHKGLKFKRKVIKYINNLLFTTTIEFIKLEGKYDHPINFSKNVKYLIINGDFKFELCKLDTLVIKHKLLDISNIVYDKLFLYVVKGNEILYTNINEIYSYCSDIRTNTYKNEITSITEFKQLKNLEDSSDSADSTISIADDKKN